MPHDPAELTRLLGQLSTFGPDDPYLVLADWLQRAGDPWGELIALACASRADRTLLDAYTRLEATLGAHVCVLHGVPRRSVTFARGFVTLASFGTAGPVDVFAGEVRELFARPSSHFLEHFWAYGSGLTDDHVPALLEVGD
ncbi:MAG: hypothetical protein H0T79_01140, partial [Deltaproteobacteria bacterium]|nr:hypothetical protein [Deltaproteobacteria bacterium]